MQIRNTVASDVTICVYTCTKQSDLLRCFREDIGGYLNIVGINQPGAPLPQWRR